MLIAPLSTGGDTRVSNGRYWDGFIARLIPLNPLHSWYLVFWVLLLFIGWSRCNQEKEHIVRLIPLCSLHFSGTTRDIGTPCLTAGIRSRACRAFNPFKPIAHLVPCLMCFNNGNNPVILMIDNFYHGHSFYEHSSHYI